LISFEKVLMSFENEKPPLMSGLSLSGAKLLDKAVTLDIMSIPQ
jgi:hypothetical protein